MARDCDEQSKTEVDEPNQAAEFFEDAYDDSNLEMNVVSTCNSNSGNLPSFEVYDSSKLAIVMESPITDDAPKEFSEELKEKQALESIKDYLDRESKDDKFSGALIIAKNGKPVLSEVRGLADRENRIENELDTKFSIASMGKMFTAVAVLKLAQDGKVNLDDTLDKYLPDYPNRELASKVRIKHLLTNSGGTGDFFGPEFDKNRESLKEIDDYIKLFGERDLEFEPGSKFAYSNYGFTLLGAVIEKASGQKYDDYLQKNVFDPADMKDTDLKSAFEHVGRMARGYTKMNERGEPVEGGQWSSSKDFLPIKPGPAGLANSTVNDILRFANAIKENKLLNKEMTEILTAGQIKVDFGDGTPPANVEVKYAMGFFTRKADGIESFGHSGGAHGVSGTLDIFPQSGYTIIALANVDPPAANDLAALAIKKLPLKK